MDAAGFERAAVFGMSEGGAQSIYFAAKPTGAHQGADHLTGSVRPTSLGPGGWDERPGRPGRAVGRGWCANSVRSTRRRRNNSPARRISRQTARSPVGQRCDRPRRCFPRSGRCASSPCSSEWPRAPEWPAPQWNPPSRSMSGRPSADQVPTLVAHARGDAVPVQCSRSSPTTFPGARIGARRWRPCAMVYRSRPIVAEIEELLTGGHAAPSRHTGRCAPCCSPTSSRRPTRRGGVRRRAVAPDPARFGEMTADLAERFAAPSSRAPATATWLRSTARLRPSVAARHYATTPKARHRTSRRHTHRRMRIAGS